MNRAISGSIFLLLVFLVGTSFVQGQPQTAPSPPQFPSRERDTDPDRPITVRERLTKARIERARKNHEELIKRGSEALQLSESIERSLEANGSFSKKDLENLGELEKVVTRIRKDLGGNSDRETQRLTVEELAETGDLVSAFKFLRSSTVTLVDELKKSSRFTISAAAIHASNTVISVARFLRLRN